MNNEEFFSDEHLNAFVDDQLALDERGCIYREMSRNEAVNRRVCELRKVRDLVQMAYKNPPTPSCHATGQAKRARKAGRNIAACLALLACTLALAGGLQQDSSRTGIIAVRNASAVASNGATGGIPGQLAAAQQAGAPSLASQEIKVLFHLNSGNPAHMKEVLDETESLLNLYKRTHQEARVEVITNGDGLNLLLAGRSPYPGRVSAMLKRYKNLQFAACLNTLDRFNDQGVKTRLLPGAIVIDSGVAQIIRLQQEGWIYVQV
ncbi:MAG: hypothetical protein ACYDDO_07875 [Acidiferrobacterales bacterium]